MLETTTSVDTKTSTKTKTIVLVAVFLATAGILYLAGFAVGSRKINEANEVLTAKNKELSSVKQELASQQTINKEANSSDAYRYTCGDNLDKLQIIDPRGQKTCYSIAQLAYMNDGFSKIFTNKDFVKVFPTHGIDPKANKAEYEKARLNFWEPFQTQYNFRIAHFTDSDDLTIDCPKESVMKITSPDGKEKCYTPNEIQDNIEVQTVLLDPRYAVIIAPSDQDVDLKISYYQYLYERYLFYGVISNGSGTSHYCNLDYPTHSCMDCGSNANCTSMGCISGLCSGGYNVQCCPPGSVSPPGGACNIPGYSCQDCYYGKGGDPMGGPDCDICVEGLCPGGSNNLCCPNL